MSEETKTLSDFSTAREFLNFLATLSPEEIRDWLLSNDCKGKPGHAARCPIANALRKVCPEYEHISVSGMYIGLLFPRAKNLGTQYITPSSSVRSLIRAFDALDPRFTSLIEDWV